MNFIFNGKTAEEFARDSLKKVADAMPNGTYIKTLVGVVGDYESEEVVEDKCDGIVLLANGMVCPIFHKSRNDWTVHFLHTSIEGKMQSSSVPIIGDHYDMSPLQDFIKKCNEDEDTPRYKIIAALEF